MRVLIGCETSGRTREAFRRRGHDAYSCDLLPAVDGSRYHWQADIRMILRTIGPTFDLFIVHPTCRYLSSSGLHWNKKFPERNALTDEAVAFAIEMMQAPIERIAMENPIGCLSTRYRKPDQIIQPWQFGDDASKATCLWLKNLPKLAIDPNKAFPPRYVCQDCKTTIKGYAGACSRCGGERVRERWSNQCDSGQNKLGPSEDRWAVRSETYMGIANAFADNWGVL